MKKTMDKKKLKLKKFIFHPITTVLLLTILIVILSGIASAFEMQATYKTINTNTNELEPVLIAVENLLSVAGIKLIISNAMTNFLSFAPFGTLIISLIGLAIAESSGAIEAFSKKFIKPMPNWVLTFLVLFISITSSLINEVGYAILIPLFALIFFINGRNPILGIVSTYCGIAFGYGISIFVGSTDIALRDYTENAARLIDPSYHVALSSNLIFIVIASIIISIVGTIIIEKIMVNKIGHYKREEVESKTEQYRVINYDEEEQKKIERERNEKRGLKHSLIVGIIILIIYIYSLIPGLPGSGVLLDTSAKTYVDQLFGENAYFQSSFTYMVSLFFALTGIAYALGARTFKNDKEFIEEASSKFKNIGSLILLMFVFSQFIAVYKESNFGMVLNTYLVNLLEQMNMSGIFLILVTMIFIGIGNLLYTGTSSKWMLFAPVVVPMFMQSNITPEFAQVVMRSSLSMTNGATPLLASFVIFIGYLNIYNLNKNKPYTIRKSLKLITPYFGLIALTWILLIIGWYIIGAPLGAGAVPTL